MEKKKNPHQINNSQGWYQNVLFGGNVPKPRYNPKASAQTIASSLINAMEIDGIQVSYYHNRYVLASPKYLKCEQMAGYQSL